MKDAQTDDGVTVDALSKSLDELVSAADATALVKAGKVDQNRVEHSGRVDEDGTKTGTPESSGRGSYPGDAKVDSMMIGKLADAGFSASQIATMSAALVGKQTDEEEEEDDESSIEIEVGKMRAYMKANKGSIAGYPGLGKSDAAGGVDGEPMVKSMDQYRQDPDIDGPVDVSPFLEAFVSRTAEQIDAVNTELAKGFGTQTNVNRAVAAAIHQVGTLVKAQSSVIDELGRRLGMVERTPNQPKGVTNQAALHKSMPGEAGRGGGQSLTKSEICSTLTYMNLEKSIREVGGMPTSQAVGMLEAGNVASPAVLRAVEEFHQAHPNESQKARTYA